MTEMSNSTSAQVSSAATNGGAGFENLFAPLTGNNLIDQFGMPTAGPNGIEYYPTPSALAAYGGNSSWSLAQWMQGTPIETSQYVVNDPTLADPVYGKPILAWSNPGAAESLAVYNSGTITVPDYVYSLTNGAQAGEGDMFLQTSKNPFVNANLSEVTNLSLKMKVPTASSTQKTVFGFDLAFTMNFNGAGGLLGSSGFIQITPYSSRPSGNSDNSGSAAQFLTGYLNYPTPSPSSPNKQFIYNANLNDPILPNINQDAASPAISLSYNLNKYAQALVDQWFSNFSAADRTIYENLANWNIGSVYIGPATYNIAGGTPDNGKITTQLSDINIQVNPNDAYTPGGSYTGGETVTGPTVGYTDGTITDTVEGAALTTTGGMAYNRYMYTGNDNISMTIAGSGSSTPWEIGGGTGSDTIYGSTAVDTIVGGDKGGVFSAPGAGSTLVLAGGKSTVLGSLAAVSVSLTGAAATATKVTEEATASNNQTSTSSVPLWGSATKSPIMPGMSTVTLGDAQGNNVLTITAMGTPAQILAALGKSVSVPALSGSSDTLQHSASGYSVTGNGTDTLDASTNTIGGTYTLNTVGSLTFTAGAGPSTINIDNGNDTVFANGNDTINGYGFHNRIKIGAGNDVINLTGRSADSIGLLTGAAGSVTVNASQQYDGAAGVFVYGRSGKIDFMGGSGTLGEATVWGGTAGGNLIQGNNNAGFFVGGGAGDTIIAGGGTKQITASNDLFAGHGNETLMAAANTTENLFTTNGGTDFESSNGSGYQYFFPGDATATIYGSNVVGAKNILFYGPHNGFGSSDVFNFNLGRDSVVGFNGIKVAAISAETLNGSAGTFVLMNDGTTTFLNGVNAAAAQSIAASTNYLRF